MTVISKREKWINKKKRISFKIRKKLQHPRLVVFRSNKNIFLQLVDNISNNTICSSSSIDKNLVKDISKAKNKTDMRSVNTIALALTPARLKAQNPNLQEGVVSKEDFLQYRAIQQEKIKQINIDPSKEEFESGVTNN